MIKFTIAFHNEQERRGAIVHGEPRELSDFEVGDVTEQVAAAEAYLSRILGLTVKIESEMT